MISSESMLILCSVVCAVLVIVFDVTALLNIYKAKVNYDNTIKRNIIKIKQEYFHMIGNGMVNVTSNKYQKKIIR